MAFESFLWNLVDESFLAFDWVLGIQKLEGLQGDFIIELKVFNEEGLVLLFEMNPKIKEKLRFLNFLDFFGEMILQFN